MLKTTHAMILASAFLVAGSWSAMTWARGTNPASTGPTTAPAGRAGNRGRGNTGGPPVGLGNAMTEMNKLLNALKAEVTDPTKLDQSLKDIVTLERDVAISKLLLPPLVNRMTGDKKTEETESYRTMMNGLLHTLLDLEDAVVDKKPDDVKKYLDQIDTIEKKGHDEFRPAGD